MSPYEEIGERPNFKGQKRSTNLYIRFVVAQNKYNNSILQKKKKTISIKSFNNFYKKLIIIFLTPNVFKFKYQVMMYEAYKVFC